MGSSPDAASRPSRHRLGHERPPATTPPPTPRSKPSSACTTPTAAATSTPSSPSSPTTSTGRPRPPARRCPGTAATAGKGEVPRFFKEIGSNVEVTEFTLVSLTVQRDRRGRHRPLEPTRVNATGKTRGDVHAALVALRRRQDRVLPRLGGHRAVRGSVRVAGARSRDGRTPAARRPGGSVTAERGRRTTKQQPTSPFCTVSTP